MFDLRPVTVLDVGCGIQPQKVFPQAISVGLDAHAPYLEALRDSGFDGVLIKGRWDEFMPTLIDRSFDAVVALDFIEHLNRKDGKRFIKEAQRIAPIVVIFTPYGWLKQTHDVWKMNGEEWQTHRSAWKPKDFPGWRIEDRPIVTNHRAFWAIKET